MGKQINEIDNLRGLLHRNVIKELTVSEHDGLQLPDEDCEKGVCNAVRSVKR